MEKKNVLKKVFNIPVLGVATLFFAIAFTILAVGEGIAKENENAINYGLGINPYVTISGNTDGDTQYFKTTFLKENGKNDDKAMRKNSFEVSRQINDEGMVLLWNENKTLPLASGSKISFFGASCKPVAFLYSGHGSGHVTINTGDFKNFKAQFESEKKFTVNPTLWDFYPNSAAYTIKGSVAHPNTNGVTPSSGSAGKDNHYKEFGVNEKTWSSVNTAAGSTFASYGDAAIYIITRTGNEDGDTWFDTSVNCSADKHLDNNYLDLTKNEVDTLKALKSLKEQGTFKKVIVLLNAGTPFQMKHLRKDYGIDACLWVGTSGNAAISGIYDIISGAVNPSGRLVDTYAYDGWSAPSTANIGAFEFEGNSSGVPAESRGTNTYNHAYMVYQEGIYVGYRYYETRYEDVVLNQGNATSTKGVKCSKSKWNYTEEVCFPFGYGLSYTTFAYSNFKTTFKNDTYTISVDVKNTGAVAGKTPVQVYLQKPYTGYDKANKIEKASIELVGFTKTDILQPGETKTYTVDVKEYEFKTYDSYKAKTYIFEQGDYYLTVGKDAHDALNNVLAKKGKTSSDGMVDTLGTATNGNANMVAKFTYGDDVFLKYSNSIADPNYKVTNQFDNADLNIYKGTKDQTITYLSRNNWDETYPTKYVSLKCENKTFVKDMQYVSDIITDPNAVMPTYNAKNGMTLINLRNRPYDDPLWETLLDNLTQSETIKLCGLGSHIINGCSSINSPSLQANDGPAGVKPPNLKYTDSMNAFNFPSGVTVASTFNRELIKKMGEAFGNECFHANVPEIYGTGAGMHRSVFGGRNWEYFSEDGYITSEALCEEVIGLQSRGVIVNIKHFALNDQEIYRCGGTMWANEQSIREIYLKGFENAITRGKANGVMSSLNRIGAVWAGKHTGLLTNVLRNEWGFVGLVETDAAAGAYMSKSGARANAVIAGNDLWLRGSSSSSEMWGGYLDNPTVCQALRKCAKNILYTVCHSFAMNGYAADTQILKVTPWYLNAIDVGQIVTGVILGVCAAGLITSIILYFLVFKKSDIVEKELIEEGVIEKKEKFSFKKFFSVPKNIVLTSIAFILVCTTAISIPVVINSMNTGTTGGQSGAVDPNHACEHKCPVCGKCLNYSCSGKECAVKCGDQYSTGTSFTLTNLMVAITGATRNATEACITDFSSKTNASLSIKFTAEKAGTATLGFEISNPEKTISFANAFDLHINGKEVVPNINVLSQKEANSLFAYTCIGCQDIVAGTNQITLSAKTEAAMKIEKMKIIGNESYTLAQASAVEHACSDVCATCGGCTNFSCLNDGCKNKCICKSGEAAHIFWVCDTRCETSRAVNKELDGIGCTWGKTTKMTYQITCDEDRVVKYGAVVSHDSKNNIKFTDQFTVKVNGNKVEDGTGLMPYASPRQWNNYAMVVVGYMELDRGLNTIVISQKPLHEADGGNDMAYNFQSLIIFSNDADVDWSTQLA